MGFVIFCEVTVVGQIDVQIELGEEDNLSAVVVEMLGYVCDDFHYRQRVALGRNGFEETLDG